MTTRPVSLLVSEGVAMDQLTGRLTVFNAFEAIVVAELPSAVMRFWAVALYELPPVAKTFSERARLVDPDGAVIAELETEIALRARIEGVMPNSHRSLHAFWRARLEVPGDHRLVLEHRDQDGEWNEVASQLITVVVRQHGVLNHQVVSLSAPPHPPST